MPTYARRRLRLGIGAVGSTVLLALATIAFDLPGRFLPPATVEEPRALALSLLLALLVHVAVLLPFDVAGGLVVVRDSPGALRWSLAWTRGVALRVAATVVAALLVARMAAQFGASAAIATVVLLQLAVLHRQATIAAFAGGVALGRPSPALVTAAREAGIPATRLRSADAPHEPAFTGGWLGLGSPVLAVPAHWERTLDPAALRAVLARRVGVLALGLRRRGLLLALAWNTVGVVLASQLPRTGFTTAAGLVTLMAWATLWSFVGVLVLPSASRPAVQAADAFGAAATDRATVAGAVRTLDALQDDEPVRGAWVERVFHPVPARDARLAALDALAEPIDARAHAAGAWHATRTMLLASGAAFGLLGRAVHCNVGRPALWTVYPGD